MSNDEIAKNLDQLKDFMNGVANFSDTPMEFSVFSALVRSSFIKNYEFIKFVYLESNFEGYFFMTSFLRSIVEDIIMLEFIHHLSLDKREKLLRGIQLLEVKERVIKQWDFFQKYRPFQPVISEGYSLEEVRVEVQTIWRENGWSKFEVTPKKLFPPTVELAKKLAPGILDILYEFIYRLSSSTVHFSPQTLLRMNWGNVDSENNMCGTISVNHLANYQKNFCRIYGALLFSFFFEFFPEEIAATSTEQAIIVNVRKNLLKELRWPEMITFEEMNLAVPQAYHSDMITYGLVHQAITEMLKAGFVNNNYEKLLESIKFTQPTG